MDKNATSEQLSFNFDTVPEPLYTWPQQHLFPLNIKEHSKRVASVLMNDIERANSFTILTGYTSLSHLIDTFGEIDQYTQGKKIRIVLGFDPNFRGRKRYKPKPLDQEIKEYWLSKGLSILQGGSVISLITKLDSGNISIRFFNKLHAKIYVGDKTAMIGSSNFSNNGLIHQTEANFRITQDDDFEQYESIKQIADNYFNQASEYDKLKDLLKDLIAQVDWRDALARAMSEVLEGKWLEEYESLVQKLKRSNLWPTQWQGLTQAMSILQENSNVLIADPTGAGKTKLCSTIILALESWLYENGNRDKANSLIVCPPLVQEKWSKEFIELETILNNQISSGTLSQSGKNKLKKAQLELKNAHILAIDEAHNYLNINTKRSKAVRQNNADYKLLITATPINKKLDDLLKMIELLDIDNLDDESFESFKKLKKSTDLSNTSNDIKNLKRFISKFTVRRTKKELNAEIEKAPHRYKNALDEVCKFPKQVPKTYKTEETERDKELVKRINKLCESIKGITYLRRTNKPYRYLNDDEKQNYVNRRLNASKYLSIYYIRYTLRSSRPAILEHIIGVEKMFENTRLNFKFTSKNKIKVKELDKLIESGTLPHIHSDFKDCDWPDWMTDNAKYLEACQEEKQIYLQIADLIIKLSNKRELGKANTLLNQTKSHKKVLAFDSCLITLHYLKHLITKLSPEQKVLVASGDTKNKGSKEVIEKFILTSQNDEKIIALCSDMMSEGVDLQKASAVTLLDLPSVIRIVEQRFGRIDRMDTMHDFIEMYWPDDSQEFSLQGDKRLMELNDLVNDTIGSNFDVPDDLRFKHFVKTENIKDVIQEFIEYQEKDNSWEDIKNSFKPILDLKDESKGLISELDYQQFIDVTSSVKTGVCFLESDVEWCFIALRATKTKSSKWFYIKQEGSEAIITDYSSICDNLRHHLTQKPIRCEWNNGYLVKYLSILEANELELLSPKKKRAIQVAEHILKKKNAKRTISHEEKKLSSKILKSYFGKRNLLDIELFARAWIKILQPFLENKRGRNKSTREVFNLNALKTDYEINKIDLDYEYIEDLLEKVPSYEKLEYKIASCIVGVPKHRNKL
ncbi:SNF2-related protein [Nonlabens sp. SY33080]|uniref:SNF2-related protein n=1 Tax=Nonlabens sp. SY33080 TaxID=2719911 RepID=UPI001428B31B|nr:SNF2-related protein [Nonlabens sp. SY33080]